MKKKILLSVLFVMLFACIFAFSVSAAPQNYQSYEVELVSGEKITAYQAQAWDQWQGRIWVTDTMYSEAPVDSEGTYATIDWAQIKVLDFTNAWGHVYNANTGEHELKRGTNGSMHICKTSFTASNATGLEKVITGVGNKIVGPVFSSMPALKELVVDSALAEIGYNAFEKCTAFTTVTFSGENNLKTIGQQAFLRCSAIKTVDFLSSVTSMGSYIFGDCTSLKTVEWPSAMTTIPDNTFNGCTALEFTIPSNITKIGGSAFKNCDAFVRVVIPDGVTELGGYAFSSCDNLEEIVISDNCLISNKLVGMAEYSPKLTSIRIPPLVTEIGYDNFRGCTTLAEVIWPNNLLKISGGQNFSNTAITKIALPNSLVTCSGGNFTNLEELRLGANLTNIGDGIFNYKTIKRVYIPASIVTVGKNILGWSNPGDSSSNITFIFTGTLEQAEAVRALALAATEGTNHQPNTSKFYDAVLVHASEYDVTQEPSGFTFVYGYGVCDAFYEGKHQMAGEISMQFNGYFDKVTFADTCTRNGCGECVEDESLRIGAMFTYLGYSHTENAIGGIYTVSQFYGINRENIEKYNNAVGYELSYGFVVSILNNPIGNENATENNVIIADGSIKFDYADVKVSGITDETKDKGIVFCMYVTDGEEVYYLDGGETSENVATKSYNDILEIVKEKN